MDNSIKVCDLQTLQCVQTLTEHTNAVMSVLCWDQYLLSCSLDQTVKVWCITDSGFLEVLYNHREEGGVVALRNIGDAQEKPMLVCSCNDNTLHFYDLPTFNKRGRIFSKEEMRAIEVRPGGLFFTRDGAGELKVWKWSGIAPGTPSSLFMFLINKGKWLTLFLDTMIFTSTRWEVVRNTTRHSIVSVHVPDKQGKMADIVLGYDDLNQYKVGNLIIFRACCLFRIYDTLKECAIICKSAGGIGVSVP